MAGDLAHPQAIRCLRHSHDLHLVRRQVYEEQNEKPRERTCGGPFGAPDWDKAP